MYGTSWQDSDYSDNDGDFDGAPMQIGDTTGAIFLNQDIKLE